MSQKKIVFLDANTFPPHIKFVKPQTPHYWEEHAATLPKDVAPRIANAHVVVSNKVPLQAEHLAQAKKLQLIALTATGYDHVDLPFARKQGIAVCNAVDYGSASIAEHAFTLMLMLARGSMRYHWAVAKGAWQKSAAFCIFNYGVHELREKTLTICGMGNVGRYLKKLAEGFSMKVLQAERKNATTVRPGYVEFNEALKKADFLSLHLPLNANTQNLIAAKQFEAMKQSAYLINAARGKVVNEEDAANALRQKKIAGAAFDVLAEEPPVVDNAKHPLLSLVGREDINLIVTPHVAWAGEKSLSAITGQCAENIDAFYNGARLRRID